MPAVARISAIAGKSWGYKMSSTSPQTGDNRLMYHVTHLITSYMDQAVIGLA